MLKPPAFFLRTLLTVALAVLPAGAHEHFYAGIVQTDATGEPVPGSPLQLLDAAGQPLAPGAVVGKTFHLLARPAGFRTTAPVQLCGGYYVLDERPRTLFPADAFSFAALSDGQIEAAHPLHAHTGAWLWMEIVAVAGPPGARFGFWDENRALFHDTPTAGFLTNEPPDPAQNRFVLSEGFDDSEEDPQGHIHGRAWTADRPGTYTVGFRLVDRSTTGPGGGPWHTPSAVYYFRFEAGPSFQPTGQRVAGTGFVLTWPSALGIWDAAGQSGITFAIERATSLRLADWQPIGSAAGTTAPTATFTDPAPPAGQAFYRLNYLWGAP